MLDHVSIGVGDIERSRRFYDAALRPLGLVRIVDFGNDRGSDYGAAPGSLGVEFTITRKTGGDDADPGRASLFPRPGPRRGARFSRRSACRRLSRRRAAGISGRFITPTITAPSCSIPTATASRPCATRRKRQ